MLSNLKVFVLLAFAFALSTASKSKHSKSNKRRSQPKASKSKFSKKCKSSKSSKDGIGDTDSLYRTEFYPETDFPVSIKRFGTVFGYQAQKVRNNTLYDTFQVAEAGVLGKILFYAYQTGSTTNSTITGVYVTLYKGGKFDESTPESTATSEWMPWAEDAAIEPSENDPDAEDDPDDASVNADKSMVKDEETRARRISSDDFEVIFDGSNTNIMSATEFSGVYRVGKSNPTLTTRPIMKVYADLRRIAPGGVLLEPNETYWFGVHMTGSLSSNTGPFYPTIATLIDVSTGNARQTVGDADQVMDLGDSIPLEDPVGSERTVGIPFEIFGCNGSS